MQRVLEIETSQYSDSPTKRWVGQDYCVESVCLEYPPELDNLDDEALLDMADNLEGGVVYVSLPNTACTGRGLQPPAKQVESTAKVINPAKVTGKRQPRQ